MFDEFDERDTPDAERRGGTEDALQTLDERERAQPVLPAAAAPPGAESGPAADVPAVPKVATAGDDLGVLDSYFAAARDVPLLTREQEAVLGGQIRDARESLTRVLARTPAAAAWMVKALEAADTGERPLTDLVFAPFATDEREPSCVGSGRAGRGSQWRNAARDLAALHGRWHGEDGTPPAARERRLLREQIEQRFVDLEPSSTVLAEFTATLESSAAACESATPAQRRRILDTLGVGAQELPVLARDARAALDSYRAARQHMVEANFRLAFHMARKLVGNGVSLDDLMQEAVLGLMRAAEKFDHRLGYKFSTYASQWIWQGITRALADGSRTIRVAAHMHDTIIRLKRVSRELQQKLGRDPDLAELAQAARLPEARVRLALESGRAPLSLDAPLAELDDATLHNCIEDDSSELPDQSAWRAEIDSRVGDLLAELPKREALILRLRHGIGVAEPLTLEEIGRVLGITRERTRQLETRAMGRLRECADPELALALVP